MRRLVFASLPLAVPALAASALAGEPAALAGEPDAPVSVAGGGAIDGDAAPTHRIAAGRGTARLLLTEAAGAREAALTHLVLGPGAEVPPHVHATSAEILYVEEGRVEMTIAGRAVHVGEGDAVYIPAGVEHAARVVAGPLRAVQVYVGPGPEQRFTTGERVADELEAPGPRP